MKRKSMAVTALTLILAMFICSCGKEETTPTFTGDKTEEPKYQGCLNAISPSAYNNIDGLKLEPGTYISIIGKEESATYWKNVEKGVMQAADDLNKALGYTGNDKIKVTYNAPAKQENIDEQVNILDEELSRYPDVIGIASVDADSCAVQFDLATANGIPVIALDSGNHYRGIQCTVKTDNIDAARTGAYKLADEIGGKGEVLLLVQDSKSEAAKERVSSFTEELKTGHPGVTVVETLYFDKFADKKKEIVEERYKDKTAEEKAEEVKKLTDEDVLQYYLEKYPNLKGMFGTSAFTTQKGLEALDTAERAGQVVLMGFDVDKTLLEALESGKVAGLVVQNPFGIGYASVVAAARTVLAIGNEAEVNTGYTWVTKENQESEAIQKMLYK